MTEGIEAVILRATAKDRDARFPTAAAFMEALEPFCPESRSGVFVPPPEMTGSTESALDVSASRELEFVPEEAVPTVIGAVAARAGEAGARSESLRSNPFMRQPR